MAGMVSGKRKQQLILPINCCFSNFNDKKNSMKNAIEPF